MDKEYKKEVTPVLEYPGRSAPRIKKEGSVHAFMLEGYFVLVGVAVPLVPREGEILWERRTLFVEKDKVDFFEKLYLSPFRKPSEAIVRIGIEEEYGNYDVCDFSWRGSSVKVAARDAGFLFYLSSVIGKYGYLMYKKEYLRHLECGGKYVGPWYLPKYYRPRVGDLGSLRKVLGIDLSLVKDLGDLEEVEEYLELDARQGKVPDTLNSKFIKTIVISGESPVFDLNHVSCLKLIVKGRTPLYNFMKSKNIKEIDYGGVLRSLPRRDLDYIDSLWNMSVTNLLEVPPRDLDSFILYRDIFEYRLKNG